MNSRGGSSRTLRQYLFPGNPSNSRGQCALNRDRVGLNLPTGKIRPVVGENHFEIAHAAIFRVPSPRCVIEWLSGDACNVPVPRAVRCESGLLGSDILDGFRGTLLSGWSFPCGRAHGNTQGLQRDLNRISKAAGKVLFVPVFRNLPPVLCVSMPEQSFILGSLKRNSCIFAAPS